MPTLVSLMVLFRVLCHAVGPLFGLRACVLAQRTVAVVDRCYGLQWQLQPLLLLQLLRRLQVLAAMDRCQ